MVMMMITMCTRSRLTSLPKLPNRNVSQRLQLTTSLSLSLSETKRASRERIQALTKLTQPIFRVLFRSFVPNLRVFSLSFRFQLRFLQRFTETRTGKLLFSRFRRGCRVRARLLQFSAFVLFSKRDRFWIFARETGREAVAHRSEWSAFVCFFVNEESECECVSAKCTLSTSCLLHRLK